MKTLQYFIQSVTNRLCQSEKKNSKKSRASQVVIQNKLDNRILSDPVGFILQLNNIESRIFERLWWYHIRYKVIYPSQDTLAREVGVTRETVNRLLEKLLDVGLISRRYRHMKSCIYRITDFFSMNADMYWKMASILPLIGSFVMYTQIAHPVVNVTQSNITKEEYIKNSLPVSGRRGLFSREFILGAVANMKVPPSVTRLCKKLRLKLTLWEQTQLAAFSEPALSHAEGVYSRQRQTINNPVVYLSKVARNFSERKYLPVKREFSRELAQALGVSEIHQGERYNFSVAPEAPRRQSPQHTLPVERPIKDQISSFEEKPARIKVPAQQPYVHQERRQETTDEILNTVAPYLNSEQGRENIKKHPELMGVLKVMLRSAITSKEDHE